MLGNKEIMAKNINYYMNLYGYAYAYTAFDLLFDLNSIKKGPRPQP